MPWTFSYRKKGWAQYLLAENAAINQTILLAISQGVAIHTVLFNYRFLRCQTVYKLDLKGMTQDNRDNQTIRAIQAHRIVGEVWEYFDWERDVELAATQALPAVPAAEEERPPDISPPPPGGYQPSPGETKAQAKEAKA